MAEGKGREGRAVSDGTWNGLRSRLLIAGESREREFGEEGETCRRRRKRNKIVESISRLKYPQNMMLRDRKEILKQERAK